VPGHRALKPTAQQVHGCVGKPAGTGSCSYSCFCTGAGTGPSEAAAVCSNSCHLRFHLCTAARSFFFHLFSRATRGPNTVVDNASSICILGHVHALHLSRSLRLQFRCTSKITQHCHDCFLPRLAVRASATASPLSLARADPAFHDNCRHETAVAGSTKPLIHQRYPAQAVLLLGRLASFPPNDAHCGHGASKHDVNPLNRPFRVYCARSIRFPFSSTGDNCPASHLQAWVGLHSNLESQLSRGRRRLRLPTWPVVG